MILRRLGSLSGRKAFCSSTQAAKTLAAHLQKLDTDIRSQYVEDALITMNTLHTMKVTIPLSFLTDTLDILAFRRDAVQVDHIIRLATANFALLHAHTDFDYGTNSKPVHLPLDKLISFAISGLIRSEVFDAAFQLWLRAMNDGYITDRMSIESLMERVLSSSSAPPEEFIDRVHKMMRDNAWHATRRYYRHILCIVRQHLTWSKNDYDVFYRGNLRLRRILSEAVDVLDAYSRLSLDLVVVQLQCFCAATVTARRYGMQADDIRKESLSSAYDLYVSDVQSSLQLQTQPSGWGNIVDSNVSLESLMAVVSPQSETQVEASGSVFSVTMEKPDALSIPTERQLNNDLTRSTERLETATSSLLCELARTGDRERTEEILRLYLRDSVAVDLKAKWLSSTLPIVMECFCPGAVNDWGGERSICDFAAMLIAVADEWLLGAGQTTSLNRETLLMDVSTGAVSAIPVLEAWGELLPMTDRISQKILGRSIFLEFYSRVLVEQLCRYKEQTAMEFVLNRIESDEEFLDASDGRLLGIVLGAAFDFDRKTVRRALRVVEFRIYHFKKLQYDFDLQLERIHATTKIGESYQAVLLLRELHSLHVDRRIPLRTFAQVIKALFFYISDSQGLKLLVDPRSICMYIVEIMTKQGHSVTAFNGYQLLSLFARAVLIQDRDDDPGPLFQDAIEFCDLLMAEPERTPGDKEVLRSALIKMYCQCGRKDLAYEVLEENEELQIPITAASYEPIVYLLAVVEMNLDRAEDVVTRMLNANIKLNSGILDAFIQGHVNLGDLKGGLDRAQEMYNQHRVKPSAECMEVHLIRENLKLGDDYEGRRVVGVLDALGMMDRSGGGGDEIGDSFISIEYVRRIFLYYNCSLQERGE